MNPNPTLVFGKLHGNGNKIYSPSKNSQNPQIEILRPHIKHSSHILKTNKGKLIKPFTKGNNLLRAQQMPSKIKVHMN